MDFPLEVCRVILSFSPLNDNTEVSATCKKNYLKQEETNFLCKKGLKSENYITVRGLCMIIIMTLFYVSCFSYLLIIY